MIVLLNKIFHSETVPNAWATAFVIMLYKNKGDIFSPENYRPIALMICLLKIFTQIIYGRCKIWCELYNIIPEFQSGLRGDRSCVIYQKIGERVVFRGSKSMDFGLCCWPLRMT